MIQKFHFDAGEKLTKKRFIVFFFLLLRRLELKTKKKPLLPPAARARTWEFIDPHPATQPVDSVGLRLRTHGSAVGYFERSRARRAFRPPRIC